MMDEVECDVAIVGGGPARLLLRFIYCASGPPDRDFR